MYVLFYYVWLLVRQCCKVSNKVAIPCLFDTHVLTYSVLSSCLSLQQFTIHLAAHVSQQYLLPEAVGVVKDIFKCLHVLANEIPEDKRDTFSNPSYQP